MDDFQEFTDENSPLALAARLTEGLKAMGARLAAQAARIAELEQEVASLRSDPWASRVTYDNVVEMIALNEDSAVRDEMRKVFEPLLKKEQVRSLRRDIRSKVKELERAEGSDAPRTFNNYGMYTEVHEGGRNVVNNVTT